MAEELEIAAERLRVDGCVILDAGLPGALVEALRPAFETLLAERARAGEPNRGPSRYQMYLPWRPPFADPRLYADERVLGVVERVLGPDPALVYFASDTPLPGSGAQRVHADTRLLFPETWLSLPAYGLVLNVPLRDTCEENGSLEYWPGGTHLVPGTEHMERLAAGMLSRRANMKAGQFLLRDLRVWHRGTPNRSAHPRSQLALVYVRPWYRFEQEVPEIPRAALEALPERERRLLRFARVVE